MRKLPPLECRHWILDEQCAGLLLPALFPDQVERGLKLQRPAARVVSIAGHQVDQTIGQPAPGVLLRSRTKDSQ